jgi:hypothetical protein
MKRQDLLRSHQFCLSLWLTSVALGCHPSMPPANHSEIGLKSVDSRPLQADLSSQVDTGTCFGIRNDFSGRLSQEQESRIPDSLRGASCVESVCNVTAAELTEMIKGKTKLAVETRGRSNYVAVRDFRCVHFGKGTSGMMLVVERYCVIDK